jgi:predicted O-methyltransferase YrrM
LRAFRDWAPKAEVVGADIDRGVLFSEERIATHYVDQTDHDSLDLLARTAGKGFDLIIDDGLHLPHANLNTIEFLLPLLKPGGVMVIEDIELEHTYWWVAASAVLSNYDTCFAERKGGRLFLIRN